MTNLSHKQNNNTSSHPLIFHDIDKLREALHPLRLNQRIGFVPTMGNLHEGHLSLVQQAKENADIVVVSIFVNPTQFGEGEDFETYPRTLEADVEKLASLEDSGADFVFAPSVEEMYLGFPNLPATNVHLGELTMHLCGKSRPGHFDGVGLVVSKLFNIVQPDVAVFGKKDYQQLALIRQLVKDLSYPIDIIRAEIVRADDGLALSSRNQYLTTKEREVAPVLHQTLTDLAKKIERGEHLVVGLPEMLKNSIQHLHALGFDVDYLNIRTQQLTDAVPEDKELVILVAAWLGKARLLDNQEVTVQT